MHVRFAAFSLSGRLPVRPSLLLSLCLSPALLFPVLATPAPVATFRAQFERMAPGGHLLMRVNNTLLPVDLYGVKLKYGVTLQLGTDGTLGPTLPANVLLNVAVIEKGAVPKVILMRGDINVADDLVRKGYATRH